MTTERAPFDPEQYERLSVGSVPGYATLQDLVALAAAAIVPTATTVLDLGCGTGAGLIALARALPNARLVGCDPAPPMLVAARARCEAAGVTAELVAGELAAVAAGARFDVIVCTLVLQFVPPDARVAMLSAIRGRLRPAGALVISVLGRSADPGVQAVWTQVRRHHATSQGIAPAELAAREEQTRGKVQPLTAEELRSALAGAGFAATTPLYQLLAVQTWLARP